MMSNNIDYLGYAYASIVTLGGLIGFIKAGSTTSLVAGLLFGSLAAFAANRASTNPKNVSLALAVSLVLLLVMGARFYKSGKFMPAGLVTVLSLFSAARYGYRYIS
ncbi:transmembrane proteins 14C-domain-containing protein [Glomus cerebriforme]|uniref:Transmembrane proteins 14C-domain-containing protein n=1 Tax=Glomus cerebriforme TaxID=658196 RepID=A0A397TKA9_9GLOM|nr:transmembrane proteins 14C-domain-containing protein [Glomus cerebriforme]